MRILIPILGFGKGGGNRVLSELANYWLKDGHDVVFISLNDSSSPYFPTDAKIIWIDESGKSTYSNVSKGKRNVFSVFTEIKRLKKALDAIGNDFDVILANQAMTSYSTYFSKATATKYYYIQAYEAGYNFYKFSLKNYIMGTLCYLTYELPLIKIVNSPIYFKYKNIRAKYYIPPGVDFSKFYHKSDFVNKDTFIMGCVGRLEKYKGTLDVYEAFKTLIDRKVSVKLYVAFGDLKNYDEKYLEHINVFVPKNDAELGDFYRSLDVLISPGTVQFYAHHYPVMEAMASKIPVITTGYLPADRSNAWIVGPYSPEQIVEAVLNIKNNPSLSKNKADLGYNNIQYYHWTTIASDFLRVFNANNQRKQGI